MILRSIAALLLGSLLLQAADSWNVFHGNPEQSGVAVSKIPAKLETLWTLKTAESFENAVVVGNGVVYAAGMDQFVYALDLKTGKQKWKSEFAPFKCSPTLKGDILYVGDVDGVLYALDANTGKEKWKFTTNSEIGGINLSAEGVIFTSYDAHLYSVDKEGKQRWKFKTDGEIHGSPTVAQGTTFVVGCDSQLRVVDVAKGNETRAIDLEGQTGATAGVRGDQIYVGTMRNEVKALDWKKGEVLWTYKPLRSQGFFSSPAITEKYVIIGSRDKKLHCIDREKGTEVWTMATGGQVDSSPVVAGNRVIVGSLDSQLYIVDIDTGKAVQTITLDGPISASPVVVEEKVIIGTQKGTLYCLGEKK